MGLTSTQYIGETAEELLASATSNDYEYIVVADSLRVREQASTTAKQIGSVKKGETLTVQYELSNGWIQISFQGKVAFVSGEYVKKQKIEQQENKYEYIVATNNLNVRDQPSISGNRLGQYHMGQKLVVEKELNNGWLQIQYQGKTAYVSLEYVLKQSTVEEKPAEKTDVYVVTTDGLNVREKASTSSKRLGQYNKGDRVDAVKELSSGWLQINYKGETAFVSMDYVKKEKQTDATPPQEEEGSLYDYHYYVTATTLNVRIAPSTSAMVIDRVYRNNQVKVVKESYGWYEIEHKGTTAYVSSGYIEKRRK